MEIRRSASDEQKRPSWPEGPSTVHHTASLMCWTIPNCALPASAARDLVSVESILGTRRGPCQQTAGCCSKRTSTQTARDVITQDRLHQAVCCPPVFELHPASESYVVCQEPGLSDGYRTVCMNRILEILQGRLHTRSL